MEQHRNVQPLSVGEVLAGNERGHRWRGITIDLGQNAAYHRSNAVEIGQVDEVIRCLDALREVKGVSKAALARQIARNPSSIRRLFTQDVRPELILIVQIAEQLDADIKDVPRRAADRRRVEERATAP
jgi:DNA-binding XRE family transcriptional regulator